MSFFFFLHIKHPPPSPPHPTPTGLSKKLNVTIQTIVKEKYIRNWNRNTHIWLIFSHVYPTPPHHSGGNPNYNSRESRQLHKSPGGLPAGRSPCSQACCFCTVSGIVDWGTQKWPMPFGTSPGGLEPICSISPHLKSNEQCQFRCLLHTFLYNHTFWAFLWHVNIWCNSSVNAVLFNNLLSSQL